MPQGVEVVIENGFATIDFTDPDAKRSGLSALITHTPSGMIEKDTRSGPRARYIVPEGNAREAGLIDAPVAALSSGDTGFAQAAVAADPNANPGQWHQPVHTVDGNAFVGGRDDANGHIRGPLRPNKPVGSAVPMPAVATETVAATRDRIKAGSPQPADYAPTKGNPAPVPGYQATIASVVAGTQQGADQPPAIAATDETSSDSDEYPSGDPTSAWTRAELNAYAHSEKGLDTRKLASKEAVLKAIRR